jgi:5-methylcytosine-specific restriction endonuclease McrA
MADESRRDHRWKKLRLRILARDGYTCGYCGDTANEVDHIIPLKRGGSSDPENLVACCRTCNIQKKDQNVGVFLAQRSTPPVFAGVLSLKQSKTMLDSPFTLRPDPNQ